MNVMLTSFGNGTFSLSLEYDQQVCGSMILNLSENLQMKISHIETSCTAQHLTVRNMHRPCSFVQRSCSALCVVGF